MGVAGWGLGARARYMRLCWRPPLRPASDRCLFPAGMFISGHLLYISERRRPRNARGSVFGIESHHDLDYNDHQKSAPLVRWHYFDGIVRAGGSWRARC